MAREIKFRAWNGEQMLSPEHIGRDGHAYWHENSIPESTDKVMQFTGLKDKNGKEIYEGDIVENEEQAMRGVYEFREGTFGIKGTRTIQNYGAVIIGNIYENPELIR